MVKRVHIDSTGNIIIIVYLILKKLIIISINKTKFVWLYVGLCKFSGYFAKTSAATLGPKCTREPLEENFSIRLLKIKLFFLGIF